jgi:hypothetical protein
MEEDKENADSFKGACSFKLRTAGQSGGMQIPAGVSAETLDRLLGTLDVRVSTLFELDVGPGLALDLEAYDTPSFHYIKRGHGRLSIPEGRPVEIGPQTLVIVPPTCLFRFEPVQEESVTSLWSGKFRSLHGNSVDLFDTLQVPIIEWFPNADALESRLQLALTEVIARDVCSDVLVSIAIKQVLIALIRQSFLSMNSWTGRFGTCQEFCVPGSRS